MPQYQHDAVTAGFTLVEMIIVIMVLSIVVLLGQPLLSSSVEQARISAVTSEIATVLRYARGTALGTARPTRVTFEPAIEVITVRQLTFNRTADLNNPALAQVAEAWVESGAEVTFAVVDHPLKVGEPYVIDYLNAAGFDGVDIVSTTIPAPPEIEFGGNGLPSKGGQVLVTYGKRSGTITIDAATGTITESW